MSDTEEAAFDPAMAAMMGFQSFGGPQKAKRRKVGEHSSTMPLTSSNNTPLAPRAEANHSETPTSAESSVTNPRTADHQRAERGPGSGTAKGKQPALTGLASFLQHGQSLPDGAGTHHAVENNSRSNIDNNNAARRVVPAQRAADSPRGGPGPAAATQASQASQAAPAPDLAAFRWGVKNANGDTAYFLPSFIEDPWAT